MPFCIDDCGRSGYSIGFPLAFKTMVAETHGGGLGCSTASPLPPTITQDTAGWQRALLGDVGVVIALAMLLHWWWCSGFYRTRRRYFAASHWVCSLYFFLFFTGSWLWIGKNIFPEDLKTVCEYLSAAAHMPLFVGGLPLAAVMDYRPDKDFHSVRAAFVATFFELYLLAALLARLYFFAKMHILRPEVHRECQQSAQHHGRSTTYEK